MRGVRSQTLARAAEVVGGNEALRRRLNVSALLLAAWMSGVRAPPTEVFLKAVDIVEKELVDSIKKRTATRKIRSS
jgi:DNA-binding transcriptional regulator YdaS (Cro superfamily)